MANLNIVEATDLIDNELTEEQTDFILAAREGIALSDVDEDIFRDLYDAGYLEVINFSHPRARNSIKGVVLSEDGVKITNVLDSRHWAEPETHISAEPVEPEDSDVVVKAQNTKKANNRKRDDIPADHPVNQDYENKA